MLFSSMLGSNAIEKTLSDPVSNDGMVCLMILLFLFLLTFIIISSIFKIKMDKGFGISLLAAFVFFQNFLDFVRRIHPLIYIKIDSLWTSNTLFPYILNMIKRYSKNTFFPYMLKKNTKYKKNCS